MTITVRTKSCPTPSNPDPEMRFFSFSDAANMQLVTQAVYRRIGTHRSYAFCDPSEVPAGSVIELVPHDEVCLPEVTGA